MALFDTNGGLGGLLGDFSDYGLGVPRNTGGLIDDPAQRDAINKRALLSGGLNAALTYLATPKNLNTGSALPYLGKAALAGFNASQNTVDQALNTAYKSQILKGRNDPFGQINISQYTPESIKTFQDQLKTGVQDFSLLIEKPAEVKKDQLNIGSISPSDVTKQSLDIFKDTGNYNDLEFIKKPQATGTPYYQAVPTEKGYMAFDTRTGQIVPLKTDGASFLPAAQSPTIQGDIKAAETTSTQKAKNVLTAEGTTDLVTRARNILQGVAMDEKGNVIKDAKGNPVKAPLPTASGIGQAGDAAAAIFGIAPRGSAEADTLGVIGGRLVSKVPRMEGPQSNFDLENYKTQAGKVGDPSIPISRRLKALEEVQRISSKYEKLNPPEGSAPAQSNLSPLQLELNRRKGGR